eukprot:TRINITY_DN4266_c0_g1_i1.p1 TRINITY_DN4266_c0_g1~~TRINITY_DN4266_c0_g1_i1.p1  ORF type:complete len:441 (-),score=188.19 TRINITY_DN4266_c0_g1_i1:62-1384(-)
MEGEDSFTPNLSSPQFTTDETINLSEESSRKSQLFGGNISQGSDEISARTSEISFGRKSLDREAARSENNVDAPFNVRLSTPEKVEKGIVGSHVEYTIHVQTTLNHYKNSEFTTTRRFSDFVWLRDQLLENNPGYLIPPLPEKAIFNRFNTEFVEYRRKELERFLKRVVAHPNLSQSIDLQAFFEAERGESTLKKAVEKEKRESNDPAPSSGGKFFSFLGAAATSAPPSDPDQWFDSKRHYITSLENHFQILNKNFNNTIKKRKEALAAFSEFGVGCSLMASAEADQDSTTSNSFNAFADIITQGADLENKKMDEETNSFEESLKDYLRIIASVKELLQSRQDRLVAYQNATKNLEQKRERLEKTKGNAKLETEVTQAQEKYEETQNEFNLVSSRAKSEIQRFEAEKLRDVKAILVRFTQININYELQMADLWKILLSDL